MDKLKSFFDYIKTTLGDVFKKYVIQKFFNGALGGVKGWIVNSLLKRFNSEVIDPSVDYIKRQFRKLKNKKEADNIIKDIRDAKDIDDLSDRFRDLP